MSCRRDAVNAVRPKWKLGMKKAVCGICDADAEEIEEDEEEMGARKTVQMADPKKPSL